MGFSPGGGGGSSAVGSSTDVALNLPSNGQVLSYDGSSGKWINAASPAPTYANLPAGSIVVIDKSGGSYPSRPTARTDITVRWRGDSFPPTAIDGDEFLLRSA